MRHRLFVCLGLILVTAGWTVPAAAQEVSLTSQVIERTLPNGLKVLMVKRPDAPLIRCILAYRVGAVNEPPGITGVSHFHEHMMFKGTYSMGIKPGTLQKDLEFDRQIDALAAQIAAEEARVKGRDDAKIVEWKRRAAPASTPRPGRR
jgi:Insulinase (Peptidase family M16)